MGTGAKDLVVCTIKMLETIALGNRELLKDFKQGNNEVHFAISFLSNIKFFKLKRYVFRMLVLGKEHREHLPGFTRETTEAQGGEIIRDGL